MSFRHCAELVLDLKKHYQHRCYSLFYMVGYVPRVIAVTHISFFERICTKQNILYIILCKYFEQFAQRENSSVTISALPAFLVKSAGTGLRSNQ